jgi:hypothetical protein
MYDYSTEIQNSKTKKSTDTQTVMSLIPIKYLLCTKFSENWRNSTKRTLELTMVGDPFMNNVC